MPNVILFSGHMIDAPDRPIPRFPPDLEPEVTRRIREELLRFDDGPNVIALSSAACGGDLIFGEIALERGLTTRIYLPFDVPTFMARSVSYANRNWPRRFRSVLARSIVLTVPDVLGRLPEGVDPFERVNMWMLEEARRIGSGNVAFIALWDGQGGDGLGGTSHMAKSVVAFGGEVRQIDICALRRSP